MPRQDSRDWSQEVGKTPPADWLLEDLIRRGPGVSWMAGPTGVGKSVLQLQLALSIKTGTDFVGIKTNMGRVQLVDFELEPSDLKDRHDLMISNFPDVGELYITKLPSLYIHDKQHGRDQEFMDLLQGVDLAIFDPFEYLMWEHPNKPEGARKLMDDLIHASRETGTAILLGNNFDKYSIRFHAPGSKYSMRGPTDYHNKATSIMQLEEYTVPRRGGKFANERVEGYVNLFFSKHRNSKHPLEPIILSLDETTLMFKKVPFII